MPLPAPLVAGGAVDPARAVPAPLGRRVTARIVDWVIGSVLVWVAVGVVVGLALLAAQSGADAVAGLVGGVLPLVVFAALAAWTVWYCLRESRAAGPGKTWTGLAVVDERSGERLPLGRVLGRYLLLGVIVGATFGIGGIVMLVMAANDATGRRRMWHDQVVGSVVVDTRTSPPRPGGPPAAWPQAAPAPPPRAAERQVGKAPVPSARPPAPVVGVAPVAPPAPRGPRAATPAAGPVAAPPAAPDIPAASGLRPTLVDPPLRRGGEEARPEPAVPAAVTWRLRLPDGTTADVADRALLGRDPSPQPGERSALLLVVADPSRLVSKTHLLVERVDGVLHATDRASTNGTRLRRAGEAARKLRPDEAVELRDGDELAVGGATVVVERS